MSQLSSILHSDAASGDNSSSIVARLGQWGQKYTDPLAWIFGRKYTQPLVDIADFSNKQLSSVAQRDPMIKADQKYGPASWLGLQKEGEWTKNKPADTLALLAGAYFGGGALAGGAGGGSAGGGASGGLGGAGVGSTGVSSTGGLGSVGAANTIPTVTVTGSTGSSIPALGFAGGAGLGAGSLYSSNPGSGNANSNDLFQRQLAGRTDFSTGQPTGGANAISNIPGSDMPGGSPAANMSTNDYIKLGMKLMGSGQQQQNAPASVIPQRTAQAMAPVTMGTAPSNQGYQGIASLNPLYAQKLSNDLIMPLGLVAASQQGANSMQDAYQNDKAARADRRTGDITDEQRRQLENMRFNSYLGNIFDPAGRY